MIYMLDTNVLIYLIKNKPPSIATRVNELVKDAVLCMSFISYAELLKGAEKSKRKAETLQQLNRLTQQIAVNYQISANLCEHYATQFTQLKEAGTPIGASNLWIACHALSQNATLVTHNQPA